MKTVNILMVCLGNICRSPLAEGILASKLEASNFKVESAGTAAYHSGNPPDLRSQKVALKYGIDISHQSARPFRKNDFDRYDRIYVMDTSNAEHLRALNPTPDQWKKVHLLADDQEVPDPYYGGVSGFEKVYQLIDQATDRIAADLKNK